MAGRGRLAPQNSIPPSGTATQARPQTRSLRALHLGSGTWGFSSGASRPALESKAHSKAQTETSSSPINFRSAKVVTFALAVSMEPPPEEAAWKHRAAPSSMLPS
eukprot:CAMPEP_0172724442 /NCGR_PEP_ID=MMETSP1074-20121228/86007_1 /TAXON_ID=2916 /ORGANISM="Ceratium fusus, Strain PA161109" /LENGTH=104 /DNA_ID=CAMNT_0013550923 /DNA_START=580 /DNA_END=893 /DNA_ORIENTATION=+